MRSAKLFRIVSATVVCLNATAVDEPATIGHLRVLRPDINIGEIRQGQEINLHIPLQNDSSIALSVQRVATSCGCVLVQDVEDLVLAPNAMTEMPLAIKATKKSGDFQSNILIQVAGVAQPLKINFQGFVRVEFADLIDFGFVNQGHERQSKPLVIERQVDQPPLEIAGLEYDTNLLNVNMRSVTSDRAVFDVCPIVTSRDINELLKITTNDTVVPIKEVRVKARVPRPLEVSRDIVKFDDVMPGESVEEELSIFTQEPLRISAITSRLDDNDDRLFSVTAVESNHTLYKVRISFAAPESIPKDRQYYASALTASCGLSDGTSREVHVPIFAAVNRR